MISIKRLTHLILKLAILNTYSLPCCMGWVRLFKPFVLEGCRRSIWFYHQKVSQFMQAKSLIDS